MSIISVLKFNDEWFKYRGKYVLNIWLINGKKLERERDILKKKNSKNEKKAPVLDTCSIYDKKNISVSFISVSFI